MDRSLKVRNEGSPQRCEICHQSDSLDPQTFECLRCRDLIILQEHLFTRDNKDDQITGIIAPFARLRAARIVAVVVAAAFGINFVGPIGVLFFLGLYCFLTGARRVMAGAQLTGHPSIDQAVNLTVMSAGLAGCCYSGIYLLRLIGVLR